jgi:hypothetical protein
VSWLESGKPNHLSWDTDGEGGGLNLEACNKELKGKVLEDLSLVYSFPEPLTTYSIFLILLLII